MKQTYQIIDGKRYNTATATQVAKYSNGRSQSDFGYVYEELYLTPLGAWFLVCEGGAMSPYAQSCGNNSSCSGTEWRVLTPDDAFEWLQSHFESEQLEKYFADRIQDA